MANRFGLLNEKELAAEFGRSIATIRMWRKNGVIEPDAIDPAGKPLYHESSVIRWLGEGIKPSFID